MFNSYVFRLIINVVLILGLTSQQGCKMIFFFFSLLQQTVEYIYRTQGSYSLISVNSNCLHVVFRFDVLTPFDFQKISFLNIQRQTQSIVFILRRSHFLFNQFNGFLDFSQVKRQQSSESLLLTLIYRSQQDKTSRHDS